MLVTITKEHCKGASYTNIDDCPLARALKGLGFVGHKVGGGWMTTADGQMHPFDSGCGKVISLSGWNSTRMHRILNGTIDSYTLDIPTLKPII